MAEASPFVQFASEEDLRHGPRYSYDRPTHGRNGCAIAGLIFGCLSLVVALFSEIAALPVAVLGLLLCMFGLGGTAAGVAVAGMIVNGLIVTIAAVLLVMVISADRQRQRREREQEPPAPKIKLQIAPDRLKEDAERAREKVRDIFGGSKP